MTTTQPARRAVSSPLLIAATTPGAWTMTTTRCAILAAVLMFYGCDMGPSVACTGGSIEVDGVCRCPEGTQRSNGACIDVSPVGIGDVDGGGPDAANSPVSVGEGDAAMATPADATLLYPAPACPAGNSCARWPMPDSDPNAKVKPRYTAMLDVVEDEVTALVWQRESISHRGGCDGRDCTFLEAISFCDMLTFSGVGDWRLPSKLELESLIDFTQSALPIAKEFSTEVGLYWTSTRSAWDSTRYAWVINFDPSGATPREYALGEELGHPTTARVRCVRGGPDPAAQPARYSVDPAAKTALDNWTGLLWQIEVGRTLNAADAKMQCAALGSGWRLPSAKELLTIVDPTKVSPSINEEVFPDTSAEPFWSSTADQTDPVARSWYVDFGQQGTERAAGSAGGGVKRDANTTLHRVRCVR